MFSEDQWNALAGDNPLTSYGWLLTVEETIVMVLSI
jgi:hypothetical protein